MGDGCVNLVDSCPRALCLLLGNECQDGGGVSASSEWNIQLGGGGETGVRFLLADGPREERICGELRIRD